MAYLVTQPCASKEWPNISGSRAEADIWGHDVTGALPGTTFALRTGAVLAAPTCETVAAFGVRVAGTDIEVEVAGRTSSTSSTRGA